MAVHILRQFFFVILLIIDDCWSESGVQYIFCFATAGVWTMFTSSRLVTIDSSLSLICCVEFISTYWLCYTLYIFDDYVHRYISVDKLK